MTIGTNVTRTGGVRRRVFHWATSLRALRGWQRALAAVASGVGCTLAMAPYYLLPLLIVGLCCFFLLLEGSRDETQAKRSAFLTGWWFGFGYFLTGLYWMGFAFLVRAAEFAWMIPIAIPSFAGFLALFFALPALSFAMVTKPFAKGGAQASGTDDWVLRGGQILLFGGLISFFEYARGHVLTGLPWNLLGQSMMVHPALAQTASLYGVYGLSLVLTLLSLLPVLDLSGRQRLPFGLIVCVSGFVMLALFGIVRLGGTPDTDNKDVFISVIQPNIPQKDKGDPAKRRENFDRLLSLSARATDKQLMGENGGRAIRHVMIWPENAVPWVGEQPGVLREIGAAVGPQTVTFAGSLRRSYPSSGAAQFYNTIAVISPAAGQGTSSVTGYYDKHHLVPFGEYLPMKDVLTAMGLSQLAPVQDGFSRGSGPAIVEVADLKIAPLICYEAIFPGALYPRGVRPDLLITSTNDAWFGDNAGPKQHLDQARLRAIESGVPMARSANTGISAMIDSYGRVRQRVSLYEAGVVLSALPARSARPLYDRVGDGLWWGMVIMVLIGGMGMVVRASRHG
ncbi:MAG: apolipoprotein N-acyltransferase [Pseudomonadota bacterium]